MTDDCELFAQWLGMQAPATIKPSQCEDLGHIMDRLGNGDLIGVLFYGRKEQCVGALEILKVRWMREQYERDQIAGSMERDDEIDWG